VFFCDVGILAKECGGAADYLHYGGIGGECQGIGDVLRLQITLVPQLYLDELLRAQRIVERRYQGWTEPVLPNVNGRIQMMRFCPELGALATLQFLILPGFVMNPRTSSGVPFQ